MNEPKPPFVLATEDKHSKLWAKLMAHWAQRLNELRAQNDGDRTEIETAKLRGRIAQVRACMDLDKDKPDIEPPPR